jgi:N6-adenosine-specific RNA methylase IME4/ParB-like chromosome segregation protein Spo0J
MERVRLVRKPATASVYGADTNRIAISNIKVGRRHRRDLGNLGPLAETIEGIGLLHPIVIRPDGTLIAGERRLAACKSLGWTEVPVRVVVLDEIVRGEFAENAHRKDFLPSEIDAIRRALEPFEKAAATSRKLSGRSAPDGGETRDKIGAFAGISGRQVTKIRAVVEAGEREPERFGHLIKHMDRTGKVSSAYRALRVARDEERTSRLAPTVGKFRTLVLDPPWAYDNDFLGRGAPKYALLEREALLALPVASWAEDDSHLYLWATNANLPMAVECMAAWGFQHKSVLTWVKPRFGLGVFFRGSTEHCLFGVRGRLMTRSTSIATHFEAPVGAHSEKPERFYEIVREASFLPAGEAFQRKARDGFVNLFADQRGEEVEVAA